MSNMQHKMLNIIYPTLTASLNKKNDSFKQEQALPGIPQIQQNDTFG